MTDKCVSRKTPCETAKICNPSTGRCVLKTGKIGLTLLSGKAVVPSAARRVLPSAARPLTMNEILGQLPPPYTLVGDHYDDKDIRRAMGDFAKPLTRSLAKTLAGQAVYFFIENEVFDFDLRNRVQKELALSKMQIPATIDAWNGRELDIPASGLDITVYEDRGVIVTGSGAYIVYVYVDDTRKKASIVNASNRFLMKNGVKIVQNVPKNPKYARKAPAGHAANYAGKTATGLDGKMWESRKLATIVRKNGKPSYRWMPLE